jgi:hypothetical protein
LRATCGLADRRLSDQSVALIRPRRSRGVRPEKLPGHSLRAGYATAAAAAGVEERKDRRRHRHKNLPGAAPLHPAHATAFDDDVGVVLQLHPPTPSSGSMSGPPA